MEQRPAEEHPEAAEILWTFAVFAAPSPAELRTTLPLTSYALATPEGARALGAPAISRFVLRLLEACRPWEAALLATSSAQGLARGACAFPAPSETVYSLLARLGTAGDEKAASEFLSYCSVYPPPQTAAGQVAVTALLPHALLLGRR